MRPRKVSALDALSPAHRAYFETGDHDGPDTMDMWFFEWQGDAGAESTWRQIRDSLLADWIARQPGTRPWAWWHFDAPRWQRSDLPARCRGLGDRLLRVLSEPRRRLGGIGDPQYEVLNVMPGFRFGIPTYWVSPFDEQYYNGRARDVSGTPIGIEYHEGHFPGRAPRRHDPPRFESQADFLARHALLVRDEAERLPMEAFQPEVISLPEWAAK